MSDLSVLDRRPGAGRPRDYDFPDVERSTLPGGLTLLQAHVPGRPLLQAQLIVRGDAGGGAVSEDPARAGVSVLAARAMSEGTARRDAVAFTEASERLGASLGASCGWDSLSAHVEVPRRRLAPALELLAEMALQPSFPEREVERLREERLNDLKQTMADPRRRVERFFPSVIYADGAAYARLMGGSEDTVTGLDRTALAARHAGLMRPNACTLIVCGDLGGLAVTEMVGSAFQDWPGAQTDGDARPEGPVAAGSAEVPPVAVDEARPGRRVVVVDRPGAPQSEVRVGHVGTSRRIEDFHALVVTNALLGGLFNSRLNRLLREERGYTYGVHSDFDMRRAAGPFAVRCAVETEVTAPAVGDILAELERLRQAPVSDEELTAARDYLVGVFPLRFETSAQVAGALAGLVVHGLPEDELERYRPAVAAVSADDVLAAARRHIDPERASVVIVGDAARFRAALQAAGLEDVEVVSDEGTGIGG
jgi:predicted Zn-dependent peptidase